MSPFTSNFTSDVTQPLFRNEKRMGGGRAKVQSSRKCEHLRPLVLVNVGDHSGGKVIQCKGSIHVKGSCNDNHKDLKVIMIHNGPL